MARRVKGASGHAQRWSARGGGETVLPEPVGFEVILDESSIALEKFGRLKPKFDMWAHSLTSVRTVFHHCTANEFDRWRIVGENRFFTVLEPMNLTDGRSSVGSDFSPLCG